MEQQALEELIATGRLSHVDLSGHNYSQLSFAHCELDHVNFMSCTLHRCDFEEATLQDCNFDAKGEITQLSAVSFKRATLRNCRFRDALLLWCDFRYATLENGSLEGAKLEYCDFYRAFLSGVIIFRKASIAFSSLYYTYFGDGVNIRKENLAGHEIVQQNEKKYRDFLSEWATHYGEERTNDQQQHSNWEIEKAVHNRYKDAEEIFRTLNGLWLSKGFVADANWAYVQGRKAEQRGMYLRLKHGEERGRASAATAWHLFTNSCSGFFFGYGESMRRMIMTYIVTIVLFAALFSNQISVLLWFEALGVSFKNMVGVDAEVLTGVSPFVDMLNVLQTSIGIILTGIFGFILGNKIRNQ